LASIESDRSICTYHLSPFPQYYKGEPISIITREEGEGPHPGVGGWGVLGPNPDSRDVGGVRGRTGERNFDARPKRQSRADFTRIHPPRCPARQRGKKERRGCEVNSPELSGLGKQYESVGKQRTRWSWALRFRQLRTSRLTRWSECLFSLKKLFGWSW
jgi:hypothetical protein